MLNSVLCSFKSRGYSHGDFQPKNIMIDPTGSLKVIDTRLFSALNDRSMFIRYKAAVGGLKSDPYNSNM